MIRLGFSLACAFLLLFSCSGMEQHACYNVSLVHEVDCPEEDCPGVCGCDGLTYCNECEANCYGIEVVSESPCE